MKTKRMKKTDAVNSVQSMQQSQEGGRNQKPTSIRNTIWKFFLMYVLFSECVSKEYNNNVIRHWYMMKKLQPWVMLWTKHNSKWTREKRTNGSCGWRRYWFVVMVMNSHVNGVYVPYKRHVLIQLHSLWLEAVIYVFFRCCRIQQCKSVWEVHDNTGNYLFKLDIKGKLPLAFHTCLPSVTCNSKFCVKGETGVSYCTIAYLRTPRTVKIKGSLLQNESTHNCVHDATSKCQYKIQNHSLIPSSTINVWGDHQTRSKNAAKAHISGITGALESHINISKSIR